MTLWNIATNNTAFFILTAIAFGLVIVIFKVDGRRKK